MVLELKSLFFNAFLQFLRKSGESTCHWWYMYEFQNMNIYVNNNISSNLKDLHIHCVCRENDHLESPQPDVLVGCQHLEEADQ